MSEKIYTFWEGILPDYLKLCMETWKFPYVVLNYDNLTQYTDKIPEKVKQLTLPKIADYIRVHVLRDNGGIWLDTDTIMLSDKLPEECILGNNTERSNTIGFLKTEAHSDFFESWAAFQDQMLNRIPVSNIDITPWNIMGNRFTDNYLKVHKDIQIGKLEQNWPETYILKEELSRAQLYQIFHFGNFRLNDTQLYRKFYFGSDFTLNDVKDKTNMLMLHNSWTPEWYKNLSQDDVLNQKCTLSNVLREIIS